MYLDQCSSRNICIAIAFSFLKHSAIDKSVVFCLHLPCLNLFCKIPWISPQKTIDKMWIKSPEVSSEHPFITARLIDVMVGCISLETHANKRRGQISEERVKCVGGVKYLHTQDDDNNSKAEFESILIIRLL